MQVRNANFKAVNRFNKAAPFSSYKGRSGEGSGSPSKPTAAVTVQLGLAHDEEKPSEEGKAPNRKRHEQRKAIRQAIASALDSEGTEVRLQRREALEDIEKAAYSKWREPDGSVGSQGGDQGRGRKGGSRKTQEDRSQWLTEHLEEDAPSEVITEKRKLLRHRAERVGRHDEEDSDNALSSDGDHGGNNAVFLTETPSGDMYGLHSGPDRSSRHSEPQHPAPRPPTPEPPSSTIGLPPYVPKGSNVGRMPQFTLLSSEHVSTAASFVTSSVCYLGH